MLAEGVADTTPSLAPETDVTHTLHSLIHTHTLHTHE